MLIKLFVMLLIEALAKKLQSCRRLYRLLVWFVEERPGSQDGSGGYVGNTHTSPVFLGLALSANRDLFGKLLTMHALHRPPFARYTVRSGIPPFTYEEEFLPSTSHHSLMINATLGADRSDRRRKKRRSNEISSRHSESSTFRLTCQSHRKVHKSCQTLVVKTSSHTKVTDAHSPLWSTVISIRPPRERNPPPP